MHQWLVYALVSLFLNIDGSKFLEIVYEKKCFWCFVIKCVDELFLKNNECVFGEFLK